MTTVPHSLTSTALICGKSKANELSDEGFLYRCAMLVHEFDAMNFSPVYDVIELLYKSLDILS